MHVYFNKHFIIITTATINKSTTLIEYLTSCVPVGLDVGITTLRCGLLGAWEGGLGDTELRPPPRMLGGVTKPDPGSLPTEFVDL